MNFDNIVTVDINLTNILYTPEYQVVIDWPKEYVLRAAEHNEGDRIFTVPFYTGTVEDLPDWSDFLEYPYNYLVKPWYVGNCENPHTVISEFLRIMFEEPPKRW